MSRWWRAYDEAVDDPKLCLLSDKQHRTWFNLCCITSQNGGKLPPMAAVAFKLRMTIAKAKPLVDELVALGLFDREDDDFAPHNWNARQYKTDVTDPTTANRSKRYRDRKRDGPRDDDRDATVTVTDTRAETEQITETEKKTRTAKADVRDENFEAFWAAYPKRNGDNPKAPSAKLFLAAVKAGADPKEIIDAAKKFSSSEHRNIGTQFIPQTVKWLRNKRWLDFGPGAAGNSASVFDIRSHLV